MSEETLDSIIDGRLGVYQKKRGYRFSLDAVLLAHFIAVKKQSIVMDLGTGSGVIPLILAAHLPLANFTGIEIQEELAALAQKSVELNGLSNSIKVVVGDVRKIRNMFPAGLCDAVVFNPPYRKLNSGRVNPTSEKAIARHEIKGSLEDFIKAASYLLKPQGRVFAIYPATRLVELICLFRNNRLEPKRMKLVFSDNKSEAEFVLAEGRNGGREELIIEPPLFIYGKDKKYTAQMSAIFRELASFPAPGGGKSPRS